jgi:hypothetical protein
MPLYRNSSVCCSTRCHQYFPSFLFSRSQTLMILCGTLTMAVMAWSPSTLATNVPLVKLNARGSPAASNTACSAGLKG